MAETKTTKKGTTKKSAKTTSTKKTTKKASPTTKKVTTKKSTSKGTKNGATKTSSVKKTKTQASKTTAREFNKSELVIDEEKVIKEPKKEVKKESKPEVTNPENTAIERRIDMGILVVIIGLFVLVLTTYLSSEIDMKIATTRILVILSLVVEAIGMIIMIVNVWKRK